MDVILNAVEVRVLGSLIEKELTTPEYYPLTLNALVNACNQISNRDPVVAYDEKMVVRALESLREKQLAWMVTGAGSRVPKYEHRLVEQLKLAEQEIAVLCVLMLRGPQTVGEVRGRTGRLYEFADLREVEETLDGLAQRDEPLVTKLPRQAGRKEARYAHLLSGQPVVEEEAEAQPPASAPRARAGEPERVARLEAEVERLSGELAEMRKQFEEFRKQFE